MKKPLVAAISGFALGGGLELALACHYRIAAPKAQLGLPEVKLGILPGSGGTQRLPRIIPVAKAVQMMTSGNPISSEEALQLGLVDEIVQNGDLLDAALVYARKLVAERKPLRRIRDLQAKADVDLKKVRDEVAKASRGYPAPNAQPRGSGGVRTRAGGAASRPTRGRRRSRSARARLHQPW